MNTTMPHYPPTTCTNTPESSSHNPTHRRPLPGTPTVHTHHTLHVFGAVRAACTGTADSAVATARTPNIRGGVDGELLRLSASRAAALMPSRPQGGLCGLAARPSGDVRPVVACSTLSRLRPLPVGALSPSGGDL